MSVKVINRGNFEAEVMKSEKPVMLDLWASWCGPCKMLAPIVEQISEEHPEITVGKINVDEEPQLADAFGVSAIPMVVLVKNGKVAATSVGYKAKDELVRELLG